MKKFFIFSLICIILLYVTHGLGSYFVKQQVEKRFETLTNQEIMEEKIIKKTDKRYLLIETKSNEQYYVVYKEFSIKEWVKRTVWLEAVEKITEEGVEIVFKKNK